MARPAPAPLSGAVARHRRADFHVRRNHRSDQGRFRPRDPLRHRAVSRPHCRVAVAERGVPGVQPAFAGDGAAAAHARRSAPPCADPRPGGRPRPAGADLGDVAEGGWGHRRSAGSGLSFSVGYMAPMPRSLARVVLATARSPRPTRRRAPRAPSRWRCPISSPHYIATAPAPERPKVRLADWLRQEADA